MKTLILMASMATGIAQAADAPLLTLNCDLIYTTKSESSPLNKKAKFKIVDEAETGNDGSKSYSSFIELPADDKFLATHSSWLSYGGSEDPSQVRDVERETGSWQGLAIYTNEISDKESNRYLTVLASVKEQTKAKGRQYIVSGMSIDKTDKQEFRFFGMASCSN